MIVQLTVFMVVLTDPIFEIVHAVLLVCTSAPPEFESDSSLASSMLPSRTVWNNGGTPGDSLGVFEGRRIVPRRYTFSSKYASGTPTPPGGQMP